jgi:allene oxide cyclase
VPIIAPGYSVVAGASNNPPIRIPRCFFHESIQALDFLASLTLLSSTQVYVRITRGKIMKKILVLCSTFALLVGLCCGFAVAFALRLSPMASANETHTVHVVEHTITDTVQEFHPPDMSLGDILGFHNPVFDATDTKQVGNDNGQCTRTVATGKTEWECFWTVQLSGGNITVEGPYYDDGTDTVLTITGGTGIYVEAHGSMLLHARGNPVGSEYDFIYTFVD